MKQTKTKIIVAFFLLLTLLLGCSAQNQNMDESIVEMASPEVADMEDSMAEIVEHPESGGADAVASDATAEEKGTSPPSPTPVAYERKIILNVDLELQTTDFDTGIEKIYPLAEDLDGFVQDSYVEGRSLYQDGGTRYASFTVRIPTEKLDIFLNNVGEVFHVTSKRQTGTDITDHYYDTKTRLDTLKLQEERLLAMLEQADELEYLIQVERELSDVRYKIESLTGAMQRMDSQVALTTVTINLNEVQKYDAIQEVPRSLGKRIAVTFTQSWDTFATFSERMLLSIVAVFPFLLVLLLLLFVAWLLWRRRKRRHSKTHVATPAAPLPPVEPNHSSTEDSSTNEE